MNTKFIAIGISMAFMLAGSLIVYAADAAKAETAKTETAKTETVKKPLGKLTCEDFLGMDEIIKPQYVIAAAAHTKGGKPKNVVIDIIDTDTLVPFLVEECQKAPKESFWAKLKKKLHL